MTLQGFAGLRQLHPFAVYDKIVVAPAVDRFEFFIPKKLLYLEIFLNARGDSTAAQNQSVLVAFNSDTTDANYRSGTHRAAGVAHSYAGADSRVVGLITTTGSGGTLGLAGSAGPYRMVIYDPSNNTWTKDINSHGSVRFSSDNELWTRSVNWENTSPITKITFTVAAGNFVTKSRCTAIGYKLI